MTEPLPSLPLAEALLAMVSNDVDGDDIGVYNADSPRDGSGKYVVFYFDTGLKSAFHRNLVNGGPNDLRYQTTCVGVGPEQVAWVADKVAASLLAGIPAVAGRRVWPTVQEASQTARRDDTSTGFWLATSQWLTRSDAA